MSLNALREFNNRLSCTLEGEGYRFPLFHCHICTLIIRTRHICTRVRLMTMPAGLRNFDARQDLEAYEICADAIG